MPRVNDRVVDRVDRRIEREPLVHARAVPGQIHVEHLVPALTQRLGLGPPHRGRGAQAVHEHDRAGRCPC
jgi:hypothetical protein